MNTRPFSRFQSRNCCRHTYKTQLALGAALALLIGQVASQAQVLVNGDFESPVLTTAGQNFPTPPANFGWSVASGDFDIMRSYAQPASGQQCLDLNGWNPCDLYQNFSVAAGGPWNVQFAMSANPDTSVDKTLKLSLTEVGGSTLDLGTYTMSPIGRTWSNLQWEYKTTVSFNLDAGATYRLEFDSLTAGASGPLIDNVQVTPAPEPTSGLLLLGGLGVLVAGRRWRK